VIAKPRQHAPDRIEAQRIFRTERECLARRAPRLAVPPPEAEQPRILREPSWRRCLRDRTLHQRESARDTAGSGFGQAKQIPAVGKTGSLVAQRRRQSDGLGNITAFERRFRRGDTGVVAHIDPTRVPTWGR